MRPHSLSEIEIADDLPRREVNYNHVAAVCTWLPDARISVDRNICKTPVTRRNDFVASNSTFGNFGNLLFRNWINNSERIVAFVRDEQQAVIIVGRFRQDGAKA